MYKELLKSIFIYGLAGGLGKFTGLFLLPLYVQTFSPEEYGIIDLIQTIIIIISILGLLLESAVQRYYFEVTENERKQYVSTAFWTVLFLSIFWFVIVVLFSKTLSVVLFADPQYQSTIICAAITIPLSNLFIICCVIIRYMKAPLKYFFDVLIQMLTTIAISIFLVFFLKWGIIGVFCGQVIGFVLGLAAVVYHIRHMLVFYWSKSIAIKMFQFSIPQFPARVGSVANSYFNRFIMLGYLTLSDIGLFTIAMKIASVFQLIESALSLAWYPFFYEQLESNENHRSLFRKISQYVTIGVFGIVCIFVLFCKDVLTLFTNKDYYGAFPLLGILALSNALIIVKIPIDIGVLISKKTVYGTYIYLLSAAINVISLFFLVPVIGIIGVPVSLLLGYLSLLIVSWAVSEKLYYIGFNKIPFVMSLFMAGLVILLTLIWDISIYLKIISAMSYLILLIIAIKKTILRYK